ncbi:MAG: hypothetical protein WC724_02120 [Candidatus Paceibacterota bacterium]|jgi:hypothetical protein
MKFLFNFLIIGLFFPPVSFATSSVKNCSPDGYTVATINGVFTDESGAVANMEALMKKVGFVWNNQKIKYEYLLNPSHVGGLGDAFVATYQKIFEDETVQDYDLVEMLKSASEKVKTKKVLLVAHSQGNFYANSFHDKVFGQPGNASAGSIAVYSVATPASRVAGGGKWLTSSTDKVISDFVGSVPLKKIMSANTKIILKDGDDKLGHSFSDVYMKYRSAQIVSDIKSSLDNLKTNKNQNENLPCIASPKLTTTHKVQGAVLAVIDPVADTTKTVVVETAGGVYSAGVATVGAIKNIASTIGSGIRAATDLAFGDSNSGAAVVLATANDAQVQQIPTEEQKSDTTSVLASENNTPVTQDAEQIIAQPSETETEPQVQKQTTSTETPPTPVTDNIPMPKINFGSGFSPGFGGGAPVSAPVITTPATEQATEEETSITEVSQASSVFISVISPSDFSNAFTETTIIFSGTSTPGATISNSYSQSTTTSLETGDWSITISDFPNGISTIRFLATIPDNENIAQQEITLSVDVPNISPPSITSHNFPLQLRTNSVTFSGTSTPGFTIGNDFNNATVVASSTSTWSLSFSDLPEGTTTIKFFAVDQDGNTSVSRDAIFNVYTIQPRATNVSVLECANSLQAPPQSCFLPEGQATISWSASTPNYSYFEIIKGTSLTGFSTITTTSDTSVVIPTTAGPYDIKVVAVSIFGNRDLSTVGNTAYFTASYMPIVINEVAWAGTDASSYDEWIELKNRTNLPLNLSGFSISAEDGTPHISLSGTIPAYGYFLIGRGEAGDIFSDVSIDLPVPFSGTGGGSGLANDGEVLSLNFGGGASTTTIDQTPVLADCSGWCGGSGSPDYKTMERKHVDTIGSDKNNWGTNDGSYLAGHDKDGNIINGTPKTRNSISMGKVGFYCDPQTASFMEGGYYVPTRSGSSYYNCRFLTDSLTGQKVAGLYKGVVGSSTSIYGLDMGTSAEYGQLFNINPSNFVSGANYFAVIYESPLRSGGLVNSAERISFNNFFTGTVTTTPPHQRYGVLNWVYGVEP